MEIELCRLNPKDSHWCFPPSVKLVEVLRHVMLYEASAVLVVPIWANSSFYTVFWVRNIIFWSKYFFGVSIDNYFTA